MEKIVGIDEVGRGSWAGPLVAAAVLLEKPVEGLKDSKLLNKAQRESLSEVILLNSTVGIGWVTARQIDELGLSEAIRLAMKLALGQIKVGYDKVIIDGNFNFLPDNPKSIAIIKADLTYPCVSAASIVAKVARDSYMSKAAGLYPKYGFEQHVGYGTKLHRDMLKIYGLCELHRLSYEPIKKMLQNV